MNDLEVRIHKLEQAFAAFSQEIRLAYHYIHPDAASSLTKSRIVMEKILISVYMAEMGKEPKKPLLGDILAEWLAFLFPAVAVWFGWHAIFSEKMFAVWIVDYLFAFVLGVAFQYFTIKPMRNLSAGRGLIEALKADTLSLPAWQVGMYGFMALAQFYVFRRLLGLDLEVNSVAFWFMMQLAMITGFVTSYPVNWWLITKGIKERM